MKLTIKRKNSQGVTIVETICDVEQFTADYSDMDAPSFSEDAKPNLCKSCSKHTDCNIMEMPVFQCDEYGASVTEDGVVGEEGEK